MQRAFAWIGYGLAWLVAIVLILELGCTVALGLYYGSYQRSRVQAPALPAPRGSPPSFFSLRSLLQEDFSSASPAYDAFPWADEHWNELRAAHDQWKVRYEPFIVWANGPFHGKLINVDERGDGAWRRTVNACRPGVAVARRVWALGGSTMFSGDNPDFSTIPSLLSKRLNPDPAKCVEVTNLGVAGYGTNQEVLLLIRRLRSGLRPDLVIFYDGFNEAYVGAFSPANASAHHNLAPIKARFEGMSWLTDLGQASQALRATRAALAALGARASGSRAADAGPSRQGLPSDTALTSNVAATMDNYEWNIGLVKAMESVYGFKAHFFWQPTLAYGDKPRSAFEQACLQNPVVSPTEQIRAVSAVYKEAERRSTAVSAKFVSLARAFDQQTDTIYVDSIHVGPRGNEVIADAIARHLQ